MEDVAHRSSSTSGLPSERQYVRRNCYSGIKQFLAAGSFPSYCFVDLIVQEF